MFYTVDYEALAIYFESNLLNLDVQLDWYKKLFIDHTIECQEADYVENIINIAISEKFMSEPMLYRMLDLSIKTITIRKVPNVYTNWFLQRINTKSNTFYTYADTLGDALKYVNFILYVDKHRKNTSFSIQSFGKKYNVTGGNFIKELLEERIIDIMYFIRHTKDVPKFDRQIYSLIKIMIPRKLERGIMIPRKLERYL